MRLDRLNGTSIYRFAGDLDASAASTLRRETERLDVHDAAVLDLGAVGFIDSAGLGTIIALLRRRRVAGAPSAVAAPRPGIRRVLEITGVELLAPVCDDVDDALALVTTAH